MPYAITVDRITAIYQVVLGELPSEVLAKGLHHSISTGVLCIHYNTNHISNGYIHLKTLHLHREGNCSTLHMDTCTAVTAPGEAPS